MKRARARRIVSASLLPALIGACDVAPSEPTAIDGNVPSPVAAVRGSQEALPYWERGPLCCFDDYAVIYFYVADPSVIPADFNLLGFLFDPRAFGAQFAVAGFSIRENPGDLVPRQVKLHGIAPVPFWFVPSAILDEVAADGFVSVDELEHDEVLVGFASHFVEELHPSDGTAKQPRLTTAAHGTLTDGGSFRFTLATHVNPNTGNTTTLINGALTLH